MILSLTGILLVLPFSIGIAIWISIDSRDGIFYHQFRVGKNNHDFKLIKFRTMFDGSDKLGSLTLGAHDSRITDWASIDYIREDEILGKLDNPEKTYIEVIMPAKMILNKRYIENRCVQEYFSILIKTATKLIGK